MIIIKCVGLRFRAKIYLPDYIMDSKLILYYKIYIIDHFGLLTWDSQVLLDFEWIRKNILNNKKPF